MSDRAMREDVWLAVAITLVVIGVTQAVSYATWGDMEAGYDPAIVAVGAIMPAITCFPICIVFLRQRRRLESLVAELRDTQRRLEEQAARDTMTGLLRRQALFERHGALRGEARSGAFMMIDLDHFKTINDSYGHAAGDAALLLVSQTIAGSLRECDLVARFGGEEFCVFLSRANRSLALLMAERIRMAIGAIEFSPSGTAHQLSASIGIGLHGGADDTSETLRDADGALYEAKRAGRNRVAISASGPGRRTGTKA